MAETYMRKKLIDLVEGKIELTQFDKEPRINKTNKLAGITEIVLSLHKLDNSNNLKDRKLSSTLFTYHMTAYEDSTHFEPYTSQYKKLKNGEIVSLALTMMHKKNNIMTNGPGTNVVLHHIR